MCCVVVKGRSQEEQVPRAWAGPDSAYGRGWWPHDTVTVVCAVSNLLAACKVVACAGTAKASAATQALLAGAGGGRDGRHRGGVQAARHARACCGAVPQEHGARHTHGGAARPRRAPAGGCWCWCRWSSCRSSKLAWDFDDMLRHDEGEACEGVPSSGHTASMLEGAFLLGSVLPCWPLSCHAGEALHPRGPLGSWLEALFP
jgi:hypothetical protein